MCIRHVLARVLYTRARTCVYARARLVLAKMPPGSVVLLATFVKDKGPALLSKN